MDETAPPRTGGTIKHPGGLYPPGTGTCPVCRRALPTVAGGRVTAHGPARLWGPQLTVPAVRYSTCSGWGRPAVQP